MTAKEELDRYAHARIQMYVDTFRAAGTTLEQDKALREIQKITGERLTEVLLKHFRIGVLDIETTGLFGDFDIIFCVVIKDYGSADGTKAFVINIMKTDLLKAERVMLKEVATYMETFDGFITYYGTLFDMPFLRTRMNEAGIDPPAKAKHLDLYFTAKRTLKLSRTRLASVIEHYQMADKKVPSKGRVEPRLWKQALYSRSRKALREIVTHCIEDVHALEAAVVKLGKFLPDHLTRS